MPSDFLDGSTTPAAILSASLSSYSGKTIIFPANKTWTLEEQVEITGLHDAVLEFNGCTLRLPDNCAFEPYYFRHALGLQDCSNVTINHLKIDGNRQNQTINNDTMGLYIVRSSNIVFVAANLHDCNHHGLYVATGTTGIVFNDLIAKNNVGFSRSADLYILNNPSDDVTFNGLTVTRDVVDGEQAFYINGYNTHINDATISGITGFAMDYRKGSGHTLARINVDSCWALLSMQTDSALIGTDLTVTNSVAAVGGEKVINLISCESCALTNVSLKAPRYSTQYYGVLVRETSKNVSIINIYCEYFYWAAIDYYALSESSYIENATLLGSQPDAALVRAQNTTAPQTIHGLTILGDPYNPIVDPDGVITVT